MILVGSGAGLTVVPKSVTQVGMAGVTYRRIGGKPRYADYVVVFRKAERSPAVKAFVAMLRARQRRTQAPAVARPLARWPRRSGHRFADKDARQRENLITPPRPNAAAPRRDD